ncbi:hypothetical protein [Bacillus benzoevorans]|uniref:Uncharacterized protein n=1 Tax=Bacillus benzoevorans TaxID=1456 RepID=A0A7X0HMY2_9BACI|nr:hypothetical protein [Bacillus benzoevorans]MBB6443628.1 hypothetical protein [Bacillus benzoevorans]
MHYSEQEKRVFPIWILYVIAALCAVLLSFYFYSQSLIRVDAPKEKLGEKVIVTLPDGGRVFTYENFIVEEKGKLLYKGERNTIDFTGGNVIYENWN